MFSLHLWLIACFLVQGGEFGEGTSGEEEEEEEEEKGGRGVRKGSWHSHIAPHSRTQELAIGGGTCSTVHVHTAHCTLACSVHCE